MNHNYQIAQLARQLASCERLLAINFDYGILKVKVELMGKIDELNRANYN